MKDRRPIVTGVHLEASFEKRPHARPAVPVKLVLQSWSPFVHGKISWQLRQETQKELLEEVRLKAPYGHEPSVGTCIDVVERCTSVKQACRSRLTKGVRVKLT